MDYESCDTDIAIIAMHLRVPGARDVDQFWNHLKDGVCTLRELSETELREAGVAPEISARPGYVARAGTIDGIADFDAEYFDMSPRDAEVTDPQQRLMLECATELLERAGHNPDRHEASIGVFAGSAMSSYLFGLLRVPGLIDSLGELAIRHGNDKDFLASRVSYKLDLRGPSVAVQTSCSSSLVATHMACQSLLAGECDMAIAGGVSVRVPQETGYPYQGESILARDGTCRPFDHKASGTVFTNGVALVLLKRLADAQRDGDEVVAVLRGTAVNNDGAAKVGFTAPSVAGQVDVIAQALAVAGVDPADVGAVEAHGTGTLLGDPIEIEALRQAYGDIGGRCVLGSVKANVGHLGPASGVAGLIKAALMLRHKAFVPLANFESASPALPIAGSRFVFADAHAPWTVEAGARRHIGVSSFGMGGTNAHAILAEAPPLAARKLDAERPRVVLASARTQAALAAMRGALSVRLDHMRGDVGAFADAAHTTQVGRRGFAHRLAVVTCDAGRAAAQLAAPDALSLSGRVSAPPAPVFLFSGQGTQRLGMAKGLHAACDEFARHFDRLTALLSAEMGEDLVAAMWAEDSDEARQRLRQTQVAQPALFAVEYAIAATLRSAGIVPSALLGHSLGELVAATVAEVFTLEDAARVVVARGRLMQSAPEGSMLAIHAPVERVKRIGVLRGLDVTPAAINAPGQVVYAGPSEAVATLAQRLVEAGLPHRQLDTSHAFHSASMDGVLDEFEAVVAGCTLSAPSTPVISNVTGERLSDESARSPAYWARQIRATVQFHAGAQLALREDRRFFIEVGPGAVLGGLVRAAADLNTELSTVATLEGADDESQHEFASLLRACAAAWTQGVDVAWSTFHNAEVLRRVELPTYPFERHRHWLAPKDGSIGASAATRPIAPVSEIATPAVAEVAQAGAPAGTDVGMAVPLDPIAAVVASLYREFLGVERIDPNASFFELGGGSLVAVQLVARLREVFEVDVPLKGLYRANSVNAIAAIVTAALIANDDALEVTA